MAELADAADLKSAGAILVGSSPTPGTSRGINMPWLIVVLGYFLGSIPTAYIAGRLLKGRDIRHMGDGNVGARNAFHELGPKAGVAIGIVDAGKGALAILVAQAANIPQVAVLLTGAAAVIGHNWPVFLGFRGGRGRKHYYRGAADFNTSTNVNRRWSSPVGSAYQKKCNFSQCFYVYPAAAVVLVARDSRGAHCLQYCSPLPDRFYSFPQNEASSSYLRGRKRLVSPVYFAFLFITVRTACSISLAARPYFCKSSVGLPDLA